MNSSFYLYGDFGFGFNQYPYDGAEVTFRCVASLASDKQQMYVRREGDTMYYGYMRRLDEGAGQYVGVCLVVHGVMMRDLKAMRRMLEEMVENMAIADRLISMDERGRLIANVRHLIDDRNELQRLENVMQQKLNSLDAYWLALPQLRFGIAVEEERTLSIDAIPLNVERSCASNGLILVKEGEAARPAARPDAAPQSNADKERIAQLEKQLREAQEAAKREAEQRRNTPSKGRGWSILGWLTLLLLLGAAGWWGYNEYSKLNSSIDSKKRHYDNIDRTNRNLVSDITALQEELEEKQKQMRLLSERLALQDTIIGALMDQANIRQPLVSTSLYVTRESEDGYASATVGSSVRLNRGEELKVHFRYVGIREGTAHVKLRLITPSNSWWVITLPKVLERNIPVRTGSNVYDFGLWHPDNQGYWEAGKYVVELVLDEQVVQRKEFVVK